MVADNQPSDSDAPQVGSFDIVFRGRSVEVVLHPSADVTLPALDAIIAALQSTPLQTIDIPGLEQSLAVAEGAEGAEVSFVAGEVAPPLADAAYGIVTSRDRLAAYVVPGTADPDADTRGTLSASRLRELLIAAKVTAGLLDEVIDGCGDGMALTDITCVARGAPATPGADAHLEFHFDAHPVPKLSQQDDGSVDYHALLIDRFVDAGTLLVTRHPLTAGEPGQDVFGTVLPVQGVEDIDLGSRCGENTTLEGDAVIATIAGRPVIVAGDEVAVLPVFDVAGDLDYTVGNIDFPGDVVVHGDVKPGFAIRAGGSVLVKGLVEGAVITCGGDLAVAGTVGEHHTTFEVGGDLRARYLHTTEARVSGSAEVEREIMNCSLTAERITTRATGRIVGGTITAETEVDTGILGAREETTTRVQVTSPLASAVVRARRSARPGLILDIGLAHRAITDETAPVSFWNAGGSIVSLSAGADETAVQQARAGQAAA